MSKKNEDELFNVLGVPAQAKEWIATADSRLQEALIQVQNLQPGQSSETSRFLAATFMRQMRMYFSALDRSLIYGAPSPLVTGYCYGSLMLVMEQLKTLRERYTEAASSGNSKS